jgi:tetratricopeptide (TPR) repeat protein
LALFKRKSKAEESGQPAATESGAEFTPESDKAERFFSRAAQMEVTEQYEYAVQLFVDGFRWDPTAISKLEKFREASEGYANQGGKPASLKEKSKYGGKTPLEKYLRALFIWGKDPYSPNAGLEVMKLATELELVEIAYRVGVLTLNRVPTAKKGAQKDLYLKLMKFFHEIGGYDKAVEAGEGAVRLDPENRKLVNQVRSMSAEATIQESGYGVAIGGEEGDFRKFVKDTDKQRELIEAESLVRSDDATERVVLTAAKAYEEDPLNQNNIRHYLRMLKERGTPEDMKLALKVAEKAFADTQQFQFRREAGEMRLAQGRDKVRKLKAKADAAGASSDDKENFRRGRAALLKMELEEYDAQVKAYPTDMTLKYELGRRQFAAGMFDEALSTLQAAKGDAKHKSQVLFMLGQCFAKKGWMLEAIETFRDGLEAHFTKNDDLGFEIRYALMDALAHEAEQNSDLETAKEAFSIASSIAMEQIGYRDIGDRRTQLHALVNRIKDGSGDA